MPLSQGKQLRPQFKGSLRRAPHKINPSQSPQDGEDLAVFSNPQTQLARPLVGCFHFWSRHTLREGQRHAQPKLQGKFWLHVLGGDGHGLGQLEPPTECTAPFPVGRPFNGSSSAHVVGTNVSL